MSISLIAKIYVAKIPSSARALVFLHQENCPHQIFISRFTYQSRGVEIISTYFSVWLWTVTQFNTSKIEMPLKVLFVIGNGFLITTWKYWIWISKNKRILWRSSSVSKVACKFTKNELLHTYFSRILARF